MFLGARIRGRQVVDDDQICVRGSRRFGDVQARFFEAGGQVHADVQPGRNRLVVVDALKVFRGLEDCRVALGGVRGVAYQLGGCWGGGCWRRSVGLGEQEIGEENAAADLFGHFYRQKEGRAANGEGKL